MTRQRRRREVLQLLLAAAGTASLSTLAKPGKARPINSHQAAPRPPIARIDGVKEDIWGQKIDDPYRWMENPEDADWLPFMEGQAAHSRAVLDAIPARETMAARVRALSAEVPKPFKVISRAGKIFYEYRPKAANIPKLYVRDGIDGRERILIDPSQLDQGDSHVSIDWWMPSPNGRYVVTGLSKGGSENSVLHIFDLTNNAFLNERIDKVENQSPSWLPDSSGFFYNRLADGNKPGDLNYYLNSAAFLHRIHSDPSLDRLILKRGLYPEIPGTPEEYPYADTEANSDHVTVAFFGGVRNNNAHFVARRDHLLSGTPQWLQVCSLDDDIQKLVLSGDTLYLLSTKGAPNGKVLCTSAIKPNLATAKLVVPESDVVIETIAIAKDGLYLKDTLGGYSGMRRLNVDGRLQRIKLPFDGSLLELSTNCMDPGAWFIGESWLVPPSCYRVDPESNKAKIVPLIGRPGIDGSGYELIRTAAIARDGTKVPMSIIARRGLKRNGRNPTLVEAYGAYKISSEPWFFNGRLIAFLEQGGVFVTAHVRGGGEYGQRWWKAGQKLTKANTWRDLIDCCQALIKTGWTSPRHLAITGTSAGGITVGKAMTEQPDLFAAVISNVGVSNPLRAEFSENGPGNVDEFGTIKDRDGFIGLLRMDAYQAVNDTRTYPAVLLTSGINDPRVSPWQVAKMAAKLQRACSRVGAAANPVLLRVDFKAGHGIGSTRQQRDEEEADAFAFVLWRTGHPRFQPQGR